MAQNGPEIHPAVDASNPHRQTFSEAAQRAVASAGALAEVAKRRKRKRATLSMLIRVVTAIALSALVVVLHQFGQVSAAVAFVSILVLEAWAMLWVGAWFQFMWGRWGGWC